MDLTLSNFRCYKNQTFHFPTGVILIDGPSGKGKSTILNSIKYALYGNVRSVTTFGERKTTVTLKYQDIHVTRTSIPNRLLVKMGGKDYEDGSAQAVIHRMFGPMEQFEATSYMMQKGTENFFSLSGAQKLHLLEQLSLLGENDIQVMKENIQRDIKDKRRQAERLEHQVELLTSQVGTRPHFDKKEGFYNLEEVHQFISFLKTSQKVWEQERARCDQDLFTYSSLLVVQQEKRMIHEKLISVIHVLKNELDRITHEYLSLDLSEDKVQLYKSYIQEYEKKQAYMSFFTKVKEEAIRFNTWMEIETRAYDRVEQEWLSCHIDEEEVHKWMEVKQKHRAWVTYHTQCQYIKDQLTRFHEWLDHEKKMYEKYKTECNALVVDTNILTTYETYLENHEMFLVTKEKKREIQQYKENMEQWLHHQTQMYRHNEKDWAMISVDEFQYETYHSYLVNHERHESYASHDAIIQQRRTELDTWLQWQQTNVQRIQQEYDDLYVDPVLLSSYQLCESNHKTWEEYHKVSTSLQGKTELYHTLVHQARLKHDKDIQELESQRVVSTVVLSEVQERFALLNREASIWKRIMELKKKRPEQDVDLQLETLKKNREIMERFLTNLESRKNVHSCPQCKTSLVIQSCKIQSANLTPLSDTDHKKEEEYRIKLPKVIEKYEKNYREWISREEDKKEIQSLLNYVTTSSEEECLLLLDQEATRLQEEKLTQATQTKLEQTIKSQRAEIPELLYLDQKEDIDRLILVLESMDQGEQSPESMDTVKKQILEMSSKMERREKLGTIVDPLTTIEYQEKKRSLDDLIHQDDAMEKGEASPVPIDDVRLVLNEIKTKRERQKNLIRMENPLTSVEYQSKQTELDQLEQSVVSKGTESPLPIDFLKQEIWDMKSKQERQRQLEPVEDPLTTSTYNERSTALEAMEHDMVNIDQGCECTTIHEVDQLLLDMKAKQSRQKSILRLPRPDSTELYHEKKTYLDQMQHDCDQMDKGQDIPVPLDEVRTQLDEWNHMKLEQKRYKQRMETVQSELAVKEAEWHHTKPDDTDYHALMETTKQHHQWVMERYEVPTRLVQEYTTYASDMEKYIKYRTMVMEIHEKKRTCAIFYSQLEQLESLFQHMIQAEGVCLEQFIRRVNQKMKNYMDHFFPDGSMHMDLSSKKENKAGKITNEICVQLSQHNNPTELKFLSGGEYDRCALAFMLSINELSHSPFLFLDESISSLDMSLSEEVLEIIKEKQTELKKMVLLISHQANTGFFDHMIKL